MKPEYIWQTAGGLQCSVEGCAEDVSYRDGDTLYCRMHLPVEGPSPMTEQESGRWRTAEVYWDERVDKLVAVTEEPHDPITQSTHGYVHYYVPDWQADSLKGRLNALERRITIAEDATAVVHRIAALLDIAFDDSVTVGQLGWAIGQALEMQVAALKTNQERATALTIAETALEGLVTKITDSCAACKAGFTRTFERSPGGGWWTMKHYMNEEEATRIGAGLYFMDKGFVYCKAREQEWLADHDRDALAAMKATNG